MHAQKANWLHSSASVVDIAAGPISALALAQASSEDPEGDPKKSAARHPEFGTFFSGRGAVTVGL